MLPETEIILSSVSACLRPEMLPSFKCSLGCRKHHDPHAPSSPNVRPYSLQGLQVEERDGFRYYQYDWSVVGGKPTALSTDDIDSALDGAP